MTALLGHQVAEAEPLVPQNLLSDREPYCPVEDRPVEDERVELAVLAARIDERRQVGQEVLVDDLAHKLLAENGSVNSRKISPKTTVWTPRSRYLARTLSQLRS